MGKSFCFKILLFAILQLLFAGCGEGGDATPADIDETVTEDEEDADNQNSDSVMHRCSWGEVFASPCAFPFHCDQLTRCGTLPSGYEHRCSPEGICYVVDNNGGDDDIERDSDPSVGYCEMLCLDYCGYYQGCDCDLCPAPLYCNENHLCVGCEDDSDCEDHCGEYGECDWEQECDEVAEQCRSCVEHVCINQICTSTTRYRECQPCMRNREGRTCDDHKDCTINEICRSGVCQGELNCHPHASCERHTGECRCDNPYAGENCEQCAPFYEGYPTCRWNGTIPIGYCKWHQCSRIPPTGQNRCYDTDSPWEEIACPDEAGQPACGLRPGCGQDAQYATGERGLHARQISGDGVVEDDITGLMWQQDLPEFYDGCTGDGLNFADGDYNIDAPPIEEDEESCKWQEAVDYCENLDYAGYSDWRLPTFHELSGIMDNGRESPSIDPTLFPQPNYSTFWSSSANNGYAFVVSHSSFSDRLRFYSGGFGYLVRCVRKGGESSENGSFNALAVSGDTGEQLVTDVITGLVWMRESAQEKTWKEALAYCEGLDYAGHNDWRLPNKNELLSIVDLEEYGRTYDYGEYFPVMEWGYYTWSSTTNAHYTFRAWTRARNGIQHIGMEIDDKDTLKDVRCIRGGI